ncbi:sensor histidine kinase [uncultured Draconibacterium sp.]|uniref:sensor histidine kinase n=1 Tax=uncultured Draconibacterium sp. TaxID=1573823 RepID=UPI002AA6BEE4|nr:sensor histidine kinase [uncultured Draconibacterium sp.]
MNNNSKNILKWRFDISTFRLIGRELITDRITALFELVKNCYDANSTLVEIEFYNVETKNGQSKIIIRDNGVGMSFEDIRDKWMVIGTASKRTQLYSPEPFNRRYTGEKGIGRFAVDKLGDSVLITTKQKESNKVLKVSINWANMEVLEPSDSQLKLFTDVENYYSYEEGNFNDHGTTLEIRDIRNIWTSNDMDRLYKELTKIVSPFYPLNPPFEINISSNEHSDYQQRKVESIAVNLASHEANIKYDKGKGVQETLAFDENKGKIYTKEIPIQPFGGIKMKIFFFDTSAKRRYNKHFKDKQDRIDGIKIYRDGIITTPFAEYETDRYKQRDILGIDKRLWQDIFDKISTREVIGVVDITKEENPKIIDATNRQDFTDNEEYRQLKSFIIEQVDIFSKLKIYARKQKKLSASEDLQQARSDVNSLVETIEIIEKSNPKLKEELIPLKRKVKEVNASVKKGITEQKKAEKEYTRKENIYLSLMSLQDYAANIAHAVRTSLGKVKDMAEFFSLHYPNEELENFFKVYASEIYEEMETLNKVIDYMLSYAGSNLDFEDIELKVLIKDLFKQYGVQFEKENIQSIVEVRDNFIINANRQFFVDIFQNLIHNSIKALSNNKEKIIKCSSYSDSDKFVLLFSDNGCGVDEEIKDKIFDIYFTSTEKEGGAGLGLYIVKTRIEALNGNIELVENEFKPTGTTFKITFPFKK